MGAMLSIQVPSALANGLSSCRQQTLMNSFPRIHPEKKIYGGHIATAMNVVSREALIA